MTLSFVAHLFGQRLRVGNRLRLGGGYDMQPKWLSGKSAYLGRCAGFLPNDNGKSAAVVELDTPITFEGVTGSFVALHLRYAGARWAKGEVVHVELFSSTPTSLQDSATCGLWIESHASYRVEGPNNSFKPTPLRGAA